MKGISNGYQIVMRQEKNLKLKERKYDANKEYSGKIILRFSPESHAQVAKIAYSKNMSINLLLNIIIDEGIKREKNRAKRRKRRIKFEE